MDTSSDVLLLIPGSSAWDIPAAVRDLSSWLAQKGFDAVAEPGSAAATLTLLNPETAQGVKLTVTTREYAKHLEGSHVLDMELRCREEIGDVLNRVIERLEHLRLFTTPMTSHARDEDILLRRLVDLGYL
jgi:hypothetical protein